MRHSCSRLLSQRHFRGLWFRVPGHLASIFLAATGGGLGGATEADPVVARTGPAGLRSPGPQRQDMARIQRDDESSDSCPVQSPRAGLLASPVPPSDRSDSHHPSLPRSTLSLCFMLWFNHGPSCDARPSRFA